MDLTKSVTLNIFARRRFYKEEWELQIVTTKKTGSLNTKLQHKETLQKPPRVLDILNGKFVCSLMANITDFSETMSHNNIMVLQQPEEMY